jgi:hemerythrin
MKRGHRDLGGGAMVKVEMREAYKTGNDVIDEDHRRIIDIINEINDSIEDEQFETCKKLFDSFINVAKHHFHREEKILSEAGFPRLKEHVKYHKELLKKSDETKRLCTDITDREQLQKCFGELVGFLIDDVVRGDMDFKSFLVEKGLAKP